MILTITPSPSIDWTIEIDELALGEVNRGSTAAREASGKGVNVAMALHRAGFEAKAMLPIGGESGKFILDSLSSEGLGVFGLETSSEVRTNITLSIQNQDTKVNTESAVMTDLEAEKMLQLLRKHIDEAKVLVSCGSLPPGAPVDFHKQIMEIGKQAGKTCVLDASGAALEAAFEAGPALVKPNIHELSELTDYPISTLGDVEKACQRLIKLGVESVLASMGKDGAMFVDETRSISGTVSDIQARNTVGSGDALLAGFLASHEDDQLDPNQRLSQALVWASSSVQSPTTYFEINSALKSKVLVTEGFDRNQVLSEKAQPGRARI